MIEMEPVEVALASRLATVVRRALTPPAATSTVSTLATTSTPAPSAVTPLVPLAVRVTFPEVLIPPAEKSMFPAVMLALPAPMLSAALSKSTVSSVPAATMKSALNGPSVSTEESLMVSLSTTALRLVIFSDVVGLAKLTDSPSVEPMSIVAPAPSVKVIVSVPPVKMNSRLAASRLSVTGSRPV
jgi:hypothetical protein